MKPHPYDYANSSGQIKHLMRGHTFLMTIGMQLKPWLNISAWRAEVLQTTRDERCCRAKQHLGNFNCKNEGSIRLVNPAMGLRGLRQPVGKWTQAQALAYYQHLADLPSNDEDIHK
jgi:hypothetical protein